MSKPTLPPVPANLHPYLNDIAERLFSGHAVVMVGSGFSRNAKPHVRSRPDFPDWSQLGDLFYEKLHNKKPDADARYLSVPTLAHEVEASIGRPALNQILRNAIPDRDYEPSTLHVDLLNLPWSDVFTTNYDTLLERACSSITSQRYDVVVNQDDLVYSEKPRIVKLHGSLGSDRPFIVTDEDYRRYPNRFAPFVSTVRQALLENTLCLIGFSGNDHNFLQWVGWIHDNLGHQNSPKMYLVGLLRLSDSQKKLLERRNIISVDMSEYPDIKAADHYKALEYFIGYLNSRKAKYKRLDWPDDVHISSAEEDADEALKISELLTTWREQRRSYPGWVIIPEDRRLHLWLSTWRWTNHPRDPDSLPGFLDLEFASELIWRMEKCLCPIFDNQIEFLEATLNRYLPIADLDTPLESLSKEIPTGRKLTRNDMRDMCHDVLFAVMRYYREDGHLEKWNSTCDKIHDRLATLSSEHKARFYYERALSALFELNPQKIKKSIEEWPIDDSLPFWEARKAGLLAEIGQVDDARIILKNSLATIRAKSNLKPITTDYSLVSQESFVMLLLQSVQSSLNFRTGEFLESEEVRKEFAERWHALLKYKCDPWNELKAFQNALVRQPVSRSNVTTKPMFDIGRSVQTRRFVTLDDEALAAYRFLLFCEDAGVPFRIAGWAIATDSAKGTLSRIAVHSSYWAMATLVRIGDARVVDSIFDRVSLAGLDTASVDDLAGRYMASLKLAITDIGTGNGFRDANFGTLLAGVLPEILSRLCCKCSPNAKERLVDFLIGIYQSNDRGSYQGIKNLTERLLEALSVDQRIDLIPRLLDFPVLSNLDGLEELEYVNPFDLLSLERDSISVQPTLTDDKVELLLEKASCDDAGARKWVLSTLGRLHDLGLLGAEHRKQFADALWGQLNDDGLPSDTNYYRYQFLTLPHPAEVEPVALFKKYVRRTQFPIQTDPKTVTITRGRENTLCDEIQLARRHLDWSDEDVHSIVDRLVGWWDADKKNLKRTDIVGPFGSIAGIFKKTFSSLVPTLVAMITPRFNPADGNAIRKILRRVTLELSEYGLPTLRLESACLHLFPERREDVLQQIEDGIASSTEEIVIDSLRAVLVVSERVESDAEDREREDLIRILHGVGQIVRWRRETGLPAAIDTIRHVTTRHSLIFADDREKLVLEGLHDMIADTSIHAPGSPRLDTDGDSLDVARKLDVRRAAAGLAYALSEHYAKRDDSVPGTISEWESVCRSDDEFAEIRNQWIVPSSG